MLSFLSFASPCLHKYPMDRWLDACPEAVAEWTDAMVHAKAGNEKSEWN